MKENQKWETKDYYHEGLGRVVPCFQKGGLGILSPDDRTHLIVLTKYHRGVFSDKPAVLGHVSEAMHIVEYMLSKGFDFEHLDEVPLRDRKPIANLFEQLRKGGSFSYYLDGEYIQFKI